MTTLPNMKHYDDEHPLASLNMDYLGSITKNMAPLNYVSDTIRKAKVKAAEAAAAAEATNAAAAAEAEETSTKRRNEDQVEGEESRSAKKPRVVAAASPSRTPVSPSRGTYHSRLHSRHINSRGPSVDSLDVDMGGDYEGAPPNSAAGTDEEMTDSDLLGSGYDRLFYAQF
jgi:hypothetical protein